MRCATLSAALDRHERLSAIRFVAMRDAVMATFLATPADGRTMPQVGPGIARRRTARPFCRASRRRTRACVTPFVSANRN